MIMMNVSLIEQLGEKEICPIQYMGELLVLDNGLFCFTHSSFNAYHIPPSLLTGIGWSSPADIHDLPLKIKITIAD